jgi:Domain of unknown function (DUF3067)
MTMRLAILSYFLAVLIQLLVRQATAFVSFHPSPAVVETQEHLSITDTRLYTTSDDEDDDQFNMESFQKAKEGLEAKKKEQEGAVALADFDGYALRDVILEKWGSCWDVDFNRVDSFGFRKLYLNVLPFRLEGRGRFRHETELDYLCHLQAVVEILQKYNQLEYVLYQIQETNKKPRPNTSPIVAVPLRLDLTDEEVNQILNYY